MAEIPKEGERRVHCSVESVEAGFRHLSRAMTDTHTHCFYPFYLKTIEQPPNRHWGNIFFACRQESRLKCSDLERQILRIGKEDCYPEWLGLTKDLSGEYRASSCVKSG